jgi:hypothetical protein
MLSTRRRERGSWTTAMFCRFGITRGLRENPRPMALSRQRRCRGVSGNGETFPRKKTTPDVARPWSIPITFGQTKFNRRDRTRTSRTARDKDPQRAIAGFMQLKSRFLEATLLPRDVRQRGIKTAQTCVVHSPILARGQEEQPADVGRWIGGSIRAPKFVQKPTLRGKRDELLDFLPSRMPSSC